jgi:hypothetical protein
VRPELPETYFNSKAEPLNLANKSLYGTNMVLGDALMVRLFPKTPLLDRLIISIAGWIDLPPLDHLPEELDRHHPSYRFNHFHRKYVSSFVLSSQRF